MFQQFAICLLIFGTNSNLSLADKEENGNPSLNGKVMSIRILRHDWLPWYTNKDGKLLRMFNRGSQINRVMKRDGQLSRHYQRDGNFKIFEQILKGLSMSISRFSEQKRAAHPTMFMV